MNGLGFVGMFALPLLVGIWPAFGRRDSAQVRSSQPAERGSGDMPDVVWPEWKGDCDDVHFVD